MENTEKTTDTNAAETAEQKETGNLNLGQLAEMVCGQNAGELLKKYSGPAAKVFRNLSTTQKVIGGAVLLLGAGYLARKSRGSQAR